MDKLKDEKEKEIGDYVLVIDGLKSSIGSLKVTYEKQAAKKAEIEESKKELVESLKKVQKQTKKKKEVLNELQKLGNQDLRVL